MLFFNPHQDLVYVLQYINDFTKAIGIHDIDVDVNKIRAILAIAKEDGPYAAGGIEGASVFRKTAGFISYFVAERPIINAFPADKIGIDLHPIGNHQNAILAFEIARDSLKDAVIFRDKEKIPLAAAIKISRHSYVDIVDALSGVTPSSGMKLVAVLLEQMTYRQNSICEYS